MTDRAAIMGSLVDVRNIGVHKSVKLTIHVPEELALQVINAFGWPTGVEPVPVAIARLHPEAKEQAPVREATPPARAHKSWHEMSAGQQSGMLASDPIFQKFIWERYPAINVFNTGTDKERVAEFIRAHCSVKSRANILPGTKADKRWRDLVSEYRAWVAEPAVVA